MAEKTKKPKRRRLKAGQRRQALIDAARSLFISKGYASVSLDEVVRVAGGSKSAIYQYFGNKEGLLAAVTEDLAERMLSEITMPKPGGRDIRESLVITGLNLCRLIFSEDAICQYQLAVQNLNVEPQLSELWFRRGPATTFHGFAQYLKKEVEGGRLRIKDCQMAADFFLGMVMCKHNIALSVGLPGPTEPELNRIVSQAVDVFLEAYGV